MASLVKQLSEVRVFQGFLRRFEHTSQCLGNLPMKFAVYVPDKTGSAAKVPTLYYLSGLTCTDENCSQKGTVGFRSAVVDLLLVNVLTGSVRLHEKLFRVRTVGGMLAGMGFLIFRHTIAVSVQARSETP